MVKAELLARVDAAFEITATGLPSWRNPHPDRSPLDDEYSRVSNPEKWRIIGARADAWIIALADAGAATVQRNIVPTWSTSPGTVISRTDRIVPVAAGALSIIVARNKLGNVVDGGVTIGVHDPAICVTYLPDCGCDACDSGSQTELDQLDESMTGILFGTFRRLSRGDREITILDATGYTASGNFGHNEIEKIVLDSTGWDEVTGISWFQS